MPGNTAEYDRSYYRGLSTERKRRIFDVKNTRRRQIINAIRAFKAERGCKTCPERDARCLDFHHRDRAQKEFTIGEALSNGWSLARVLKEAEKCDIVCSNCHRKAEIPLDRGFDSRRPD
jgi:hypothetical protein